MWWPIARCGLALLLLAMGAPQLAAQALPPGMLEAKPQPWEVETPQAGGHGSSRYLFVGTLRCKNAGEAIVGVRVLRSEVVDLIQIGCARIDCTDLMECTWQKLERGAYAGKPNDKSQSAIAVCPHDAVIAGFRARLRVAGTGPVDYVSDLQFECARLIGTALPPGDGQADGGVPVSDGQRSWLPYASSESSNGSAVPEPAWDLEARCDQRAATGVSLAVGSYKPTGQPVIQALSLFCTKAPAAVGTLADN